MAKRTRVPLLGVFYFPPLASLARAPWRTNSHFFFLPLLSVPFLLRIKSPIFEEPNLPVPKQIWPGKA